MVNSGIEERYREILNRVNKRKKEVEEFAAFLEEKTAWLKSPASTRFHLNRKGGLLEHSVHVAEILFRLRETLAPDIHEESCTLVGLFHDAGKAGLPGKPYYLPNDNEWEIQKRGITYKVNPELVKVGIPQRSLLLISKLVPLNQEEVQAILYHDGLYVPEGEKVAHREEPLTLLLHWADYWSSQIIEEGRRPFSREEYF